MGAEGGAALANELQHMPQLETLDLQYALPSAPRGSSIVTRVRSAPARVRCVL
jgi:hypothetical protein